MTSLQSSTEFKNGFSQLPPAGQVEVATVAMSELNAKEQEEVMKASGAMPPPSYKARDRLWLIVISSASFILVVSALVLLATIAFPSTSAQVAITVFTAILGFIAGVFVPSPVAKEG